MKCLKKATKLFLNKAIPLGAVLFTIFFLFGCTTSESKVTIKDHNEITFSGFVLEQTYSKDDFVFYTYSDIHQKINLETMSNVPESIAEKIISDKVDMFQSIFEKKRVDYPGQYTQYIECPAEFKPLFEEKEIFGGKISFFRTFANSNYVAGACSPDLVIYKSIYGLLFCKNSEKVYEFSYFSNIDGQEDVRIENFLGAVECEEQT